MPEQAHQEQQQRGAEEGGGGDGADLQRRESKARQVAGKEHAGDAIGEATSCPGPDQARGVAGSSRGQQAPHRATSARQEDPLRSFRSAVLTFILRIPLGALVQVTGK